MKLDADTKTLETPTVSVSIYDFPKSLIAKSLKKQVHKRDTQSYQGKMITMSNNLEYDLSMSNLNHIDYDIDRERISALFHGYSPAAKRAHFAEKIEGINRSMDHSIFHDSNNGDSPARSRMNSPTLERELDA